MFVKQAVFQNFRNFQNLDLAFDQGFVVLAGPNGSGKTNFLEGLYFGATLGRFPTSQLSQLMHKQEHFFHVLIGLRNADEERLEVFVSREDEPASSAGGRTTLRLKVNHQIESRAGYTGHASVISFLPEDLNLLTHSPAGRRRFLSEALTGSSRAHHHAIIQYERALKQRNQFLQIFAAGDANGSQYDIWDEQAADFGSQVTKGRMEFVDFANVGIASILDIISPDLTGIRFEYRASGAPTKEEFLQKLAAARPREQEAQTTIIGPHRDDLFTLRGNSSVVGYLSRGQLRSITLALKILEKRYLEKFGRHPLILLDDVFSEFDEVHQRQLMEFLKGFEQVFLTTAHLKEIQEFLPANCQLYNVDNGVATPVINTNVEQPV